jgi:DNA polymerase-3 subunit delta
MIITLSGSNSFLLKTELYRHVNKFLKEHGDLALERLDGEEAELDRIQESVTSLPFLAGKKMVVLRQPSAQKQFVEQIEPVLAGVSETTDLIIIEPKLDKRSVYYKTLKSKTDFHEFSEPDEAGLAAWLVKSAKERGGTLSPADARFLVERVGQNQQLLANELRKLIDYAEKVTRKNIELLTEPTPQSSVFELLDAALAGKTKRAMELYEEQRKQKVEPQQIIAMIAWQLHVLAVLAAAGDRALAEITSEAKISPYTMRKSGPIAKQLGLPHVQSMVADVLHLDVDLKRKSIDADEAVRNLLIRLGQ